MITGQLVLRRMAYGIANQGDNKILVFKDGDSGLQIVIPLTAEEFETFAGNIRNEKIIQATVIPQEAVKTIEKIKQG